MSSLYFAYGSNMDERVMRARCPSCRYLGAARLDEHRLAFTRRSIQSGTGVADVVPDPRSVVWGVLYELNDSDLDALDRKEGHGWAYARERKHVTLATDGTGHDAITYTVLEKESTEVGPSHEYLDRLVSAARHRALPSAYLAKLEALHPEPLDEEEGNGFDAPSGHRRGLHAG